MFIVMAEKKKGIRLLEASEKYGKPFDPACLIETDLPYEIL
jgi:hypothetical protein